MASHRKFDVKTRAIFDNAQAKIQMLRALLLNPEQPDKNSIKTDIKLIQDEVKKLKKEYYERAHLELIESSKTLLAELRNYDSKQIKKY